MRSLAMYFNNRLEFALVSNNVTELHDEFHVTQVPTLLVRRSSGEVQQYDGPFNAVALSDFLRKFAPDRIEDEVNR
jgi:hypothetical protein